MGKVVAISVPPRQGRTPPTSRAIAKLARVSQATVSRVARGDPSVSAPLRDRVLGVLAETGYRPDAFARSMRTGQSGLVGFAMADLTEADPRLLAAFEQEAARRELGLLVWRMGAHEGRGGLEPRTAQGHFLVNRMLGEEVGPGSLSAPSVLISYAGQQDRMDEVAGDDEASGYEMSSYFANAGRLRVGIVGPGAAGPKPARCVVGFRRGAAVHDQYLLRSVILNLRGGTGDAPPDFAGLLRGATLPQAILCTDERSGRGVIEAAREAGLRIPDDLWVVAFATSRSATAELLGLTIIHPRLDRLAETAFDTLLERLRDGERPPRRVLVPNTTVPAASTAFTPAG